ncbi:MAG TPA: alpha-galactosidase [Acidimicrobiales bacterium]|nr:alpha-galactosidase [Acidimicrobiales bacterium]
MAKHSEDPAPREQDWVRLRSWAGELFDAAEHLPVSFCYDGEAVHGLPDSWRPARQSRRVSSTITETVFRGRHQSSGLEASIEVVTYDDYPVVEWTTWFTNPTDGPSSILEGPLALDARFSGEGPVLRHCNGDFASKDGYLWQSSALSNGEGVEMEPYLGRPCDRAFPYFRLLFPQCGLALALGWPGQWRARFRGEGGSVVAQAGQADVRMYLLPGESVRTPRMTLLAWSGDEARAVNLWRRWYGEHVMPRPGGQPISPLLHLASTDDGPGGEFTGATEQNQVEYQERFAEAGLAPDVWWVDAGWYPCKDASADETHWCVTGTWAADPERFPRGLAPVSANAGRRGAQLLLWFEPERVFPGTSLAKNHAEWVLGRPGWEPGRRPPRPTTEPAHSFWLQDVSGLLDFSNPDCQTAVSDMISGLVETYGIGIYREDFNYGPLDFWRAHDPVDRRGATENLYVQGHLRFWDTLLERHRGLLIDSCASGGRRNDLETMRRSVPLHFTDFGYGLHPVKLDFEQTMYEWLPYFKETTQSWDVDDAVAGGIVARDADSFAFHCALAPMLGPSLDARRLNEYDLDKVRQMVAIWRRAVPYVLRGDYYALTPAGRSGTEWVGRQFCSHEGDEGFVQAIRHRRCPEERRTLHLRRLNADASYVLEEVEAGEQRLVDGPALINDGLTFELLPRSGSIWFYRRQTENAAPVPAVGPE